jgi:hypothetical protein
MKTLILSFSKKEMAMESQNPGARNQIMERRKAGQVILLTNILTISKQHL